MKKSPENISFIGREGAGKSTQAHELASYIGKPYISTGDILRDLAANNQDAWGDACRKMFSQKTYLDGDLLIKILIDRLSQPDCENGFVLDGGFRTLEETLIFKEMLVSSGRDYPLIIFHLRLAGWLGMDRLVTGKEARLRGDDNIEAVLSRMAKYQHQLPQRLNTIKSTPNWRVININGQKSPDQIFADLLSKLAQNA